jgi:glycosyltransferase involved in cell wall biosynthesis
VELSPVSFVSACASHRASDDGCGVEKRPIAGYVGVVDGRIDLELLAALAEQLPDWDIHMVGPVTEVDEFTLPLLPNIRYLGAHGYRELPAAMARFDVVLMPFALNSRTWAMSRTKMLEYFAAGLPIVSTPVPAVVSDFGNVVTLCDDATGFAHVCRAFAG